MSQRQTEQETAEECDAGTCFYCQSPETD